MKKETQVIVPEELTIETALIAYKIKDVTLKALEMFKEAESLECIDTVSRRIIGKHRADIKSLRPKINRVRIDRNKEFEEKNKAVATLIENALDSSYSVFDEKIKAYDSIAEAKRLVKVEAERKRLGLIQWYMDGLEEDCSPIPYNTPSDEIAWEKLFLKCLDVSAVDFQEFTEKAELMVSNAIELARMALAARTEYETEQAKAAQVKADQEAEAKRLADEKAEFAAEKKAQEDAMAKKAKEEQAKLDAIKAAEEKKIADAKAELEAKQKAAEEEAQKKADEAAKVQRKIEEQNRLEREALEKEKAEIETAKQTEVERNYAQLWDDAHEINFNLIYAGANTENVTFDEETKIAIDILHAVALEENDEFDLARKEKLKDDAERCAAVDPDKIMIQKFADELDEWTSKIIPSKTNTIAAGSIVVKFLSDIESAIDRFEKAGADLV